MQTNESKWRKDQTSRHLVQYVITEEKYEVQKVYRNINPIRQLRQDAQGEGGITEIKEELSWY
jgi:hypothetical protein